MPRAIKGRSRWRRDELDTLCQLATQRTNTQLADILGRSVASVACKIALHKLRGKGRTEQVVTPHRVARMMQLSERIAQLKKMKVTAV